MEYNLKKLWNPILHTCACMHAQLLSRVQLFVTLWAVACQGILRGLPCPPPGALPDLGIKSRTLMSPALAGGFFITGTTWEALYTCN